MFTGIIEQTGKVVSLEDRGGIRRLTIETPELAGRLREGDSLAVSGVCLTALDINPRYFYADLAEETLARTTLGSLQSGIPVNLELPTPSGAPLGGHVVQGHVDGTGKVLSLEPVHPDALPEETDWRLVIRIPGLVMPYVVEKGSIAIEGISLTVARVNDDVVEIAILPLTYARTNLHALKAGDPINIEADVLMKLAAKTIHKEPELELTEDWLVSNGF